MLNRPSAALALLSASLLALVVSAALYLVPGAPAPLLLGAPRAPAADPIPAYPVTIRDVKMKRGDNFVGALVREGVGFRAAHELAARLAAKGAELRRVRPSHDLTIAWNHRHEPIEVRYAPSAWVRFAVVAGAGGWTVTRAETAPEVRVEAVRGEVRRSLFDTIEAAGESPQLVLAMVEIFSSDFDFTADTQQGDRFRLLVEKRYADGAFVDYGRIRVAQYRSDDRVLAGVGYTPHGNGRWGYYDPAGRSLKKSFLKSPLEFTRITSRFTYRRPHPILGGVRPHLAIDYAAPIGTPVRAVADGVVTASGRNGGYGISISVRHRAGYATMYNHLSKLASGVHRGARVRQRQVIGYVGMTGLATGPHLDYRVSKSGHFVNPLSEKFIPGEPLTGGDRARFLEHARAELRRLEDATPNW